MVVGLSLLIVINYKLFLLVFFFKFYFRMQLHFQWCSWDVNLLAPNFQHTLNANENSKKWMSKLLFYWNQRLSHVLGSRLLCLSITIQIAIVRLKTEKHKNSTFASKAAKSRAGFLFRITHQSMERSRAALWFLTFTFKKPSKLSDGEFIKWNLVDFSLLIDLVKRRSIENVPLFRQNVK